MNNVVGQNVERYVNEQINQRQKVHGKLSRSNSDIQYLNNRNAWVKLASGVFLEDKKENATGGVTGAALKATSPGSKFGKGMEVPMEYVLFNGVTEYTNKADKSNIITTDVKTDEQINKEFDEALADLKSKHKQGEVFKTPESMTNILSEVDQLKKYKEDKIGVSSGTRRSGIGPRGAYDTSDKDFGTVPMPGIISADIKTRNRGSIKEANIKIKANSRRQFEIIEEIYLRLGYDMLLEWGWDKYIGNDGKHKRIQNTLVEDEWFDPINNFKGFKYWLPKIQKYREKYDANYDGAFMKVVNFNWKFAKNGTYDINLKLISHGDVIESLRTVPPSTELASSPSLTVDDYLTKVLYKDRILNRELDFTKIQGEKITSTSDIAEYKIKTDAIKDGLSEHLFNLNFIGYGLNNHLNFKYWSVRQKEIEAAETARQKANIDLFSVKGLKQYVADIDENIRKGTYNLARGVGFSRGTARTLSGGKSSLINSLTDSSNEVANQIINAEGYEVNTDNTQFFEISKLIYSDPGKNAFYHPASPFSSILITSFSDFNPYSLKDGIRQEVGRAFFGIKQPTYTYPLVPQEDQSLKEQGFDYVFTEKEHVDVVYLNKFGEVKSEKKDTNINNALERFEASEMPCYVRFGYLLYVLEKYFLPKDNGGSGNSLFKIDSSSAIVMYVPPHQNMTLSYKPSHFIFNNPEHNFNTLKRSIKWEFGIYDGLEDPWIRVFPNTTKSQQEKRKEATEEGFFNKYWGKITDKANEIKDAVTSAKSFQEGALNLYNALGLGNTHTKFLDGRHIYININYLINKIPIAPNDNNESRIDIFGFLKTICTDINQALGNVNNLEPIMDENTNTLKIIDTTNFPLRDALFNELNIPSIPKDEIHPVQVYGYKDTIGTFVRDLDLATKISKEFAAMVTIGATAKGSAPSLDATAFSRFNAGKLNRFSTDFDYPTDPDELPPDIFVDFIMGTIKDYGASIGFAADTDFTATSRDKFLGKLDESIQNKNIRSVEDYFKAHEGRQYRDTVSGSPSVGFLPFGIGLELDGISGVRIYNQLTINTDFLPSNYPKTLDFVLKGVSHKLQKNDWITSLDTIACPKSLPTPVPPPINRVPILDAEINSIINGKSVMKDGKYTSLSEIGGCQDASSTRKPSHGFTFGPIYTRFDKFKITAGSTNSLNIREWKKNGRVERDTDLIKWTKSITTEQENNIRLLIYECYKENIVNPTAQVAILSVIAKESNFIPKYEKSYRNTSARHIYNTFKSPKLKSRKMGWGSDFNTKIAKYINQIKKDDEKFWDFVYGIDAIKLGAHGGVNGWTTDKGKDPMKKGDGAKYRGAGFNQITFKQSWKKYGKLAWGDENFFINNPSKMNDPEIAAKTAIKFLSRRLDSAPYKVLGTTEFGVRNPNSNDWACLSNAIMFAAAANAGWGKDPSSRIAKAEKKFVSYGFYVSDVYRNMV
jgi:hypothetical protein